MMADRYRRLGDSKIFTENEMEPCWRSGTGEADDIRVLSSS